MEPSCKHAYYNPDQSAEPPKPIYSWSTIANDTEILGVSLDYEDGHAEWDEVLVAGEEQRINRITRSLKGDIVLSSVYNNERLIIPENCYLQSDSAYSLTSISSRISDPEDLNLGNICGCLCVKDQLGYLLKASDEELGIPTSRLTSVEFDKMMDFNIEDDNCLNVEFDFQEFAKMERSFYFEELVDLELCEVANVLCYEGNTENGSFALML